MSCEQGLASLATHELRGLRNTVVSGAIAVPLSSAGLQMAGFTGQEWLAERLAGLDKAGLVAVLDLVIAERTSGSHPSLDLVWTGPEAAASTTRDTQVVMLELFQQARRRVLLAGYAFDSGKDLFAGLHDNVTQYRVRVQMFLNIPRAARGVEPAKHARMFAQQFQVDNWPWTDKLPDFYYDPRTVEPNAVESLHAKCIVVDDRWTLIGSANFTARGQSRNIELGVLIDDAGFARQVAMQWQGLVNQRLVEQIVL